MCVCWRRLRYVRRCVFVGVGLGTCVGVSVGVFV